MKRVNILLKRLFEATLVSLQRFFKVFFDSSLHFTKYIWRKLHNLTVDIGRETGILAISLMVNRRLHPFERSLWLFIVGAAIYAAINLSGRQINRYYTSPTVISVDRDYRAWEGYLPGVTLCYHDQIDTYKANEFIENVWNVSIVHEDYFYFMEFLYAVLNATASNYVDLARFAEDERFDQVDLYEVVRLIDRPFEQVFTSFDANFEVEVVQVMTERGSCYVMNSPIARILNGTELEYDDLQLPLKCRFGKQQCYIKMDLYEGTGTLDVHSPFEVSATDSSVIPLHKSYEVIASYKVLETVASKNLRELGVDQRRCVFHDEETSQLKVYSKTLCLTRCRAVMALEMCNCVPFFYQFVEGPKCSPAGFECLMDFKWPIWALHICKCPNTCTEIKYTVQTIKRSSWGFKSIEDGLKTDVATSSFRWDLIPPKMRMRRDVVFSFEDLLVSFGGALALFLGVSILSVIHLAYAIITNTLETIQTFSKYLALQWRIKFNDLKNRIHKSSTNTQLSNEVNVEIPQQLIRRRSKRIIQQQHHDDNNDMTFNNAERYLGTTPHFVRIK